MKGLFAIISKKNIAAVVAIIAVITSAGAYFLNTVNPYSEFDIDTTPPDSLRAYMLNAKRTVLFTKWQNFKKNTQQDSLLELVHNNFVDIQRVGLMQLDQAALYKNFDQHQTAVARFKTIREIARDMIVVFQDSFLLHELSYVQSLNKKQLKFRTEASFAYSKAYDLLMENNYHESQKAFKVAFEMAEKIADDRLKVDAMSFLQWFLILNGQYNSVPEVGKQLLDNAERIGYQMRAATAHRQIAEAFLEMDSNFYALDHIKKAIVLTKLMNDQFGLLNSYFMKAQIYCAMAKYEAADTCLQKITHNISHTLLGRVSRQKAQLYFELGEYGKSQQMYEDAIRFFQQQKSTINEAIALSDYSVLLQHMGELDSALKHERRALGLKKTVNNIERVALSYAKLGLIYFELDSLQKAKASLYKALELNGPSRKRPRTDIWLRLGNVYLKEGETDSAVIAFEYAQTLSDSTDYNFGKANAFIGLGSIALTKERINKAYDYFGAALAISEKKDDPRLKSDSYFGLAMVNKKSGNLEKAVSNINKSIETVEKVRANIYRESQKISFFSTNQTLFDEAVLLTSRFENKATSLHFSERSKARALLDAFGKVSVSEMDSTLNNFFVKRVTVFEKLQKNIPAHIQVVEYHISADSLYVWLINTNRILLKKAAISSRMLTQITHLYLNSIGAKNLTSFQAKTRKNMHSVYEKNVEYSKTLFEFLINPIFKELDVNKNIVVIPDGILHKVPFGALMNKNNLYLEELFVISKAPSLAILSEASNLNKKIIDPGFSEFLIVADNFASNRAQKKQISRYFQNRTFIEGKKATYDNLKRALTNKPEIVHFSIHAVADERHPMNSYFELFTTGSFKREVYVREFLNLDFSNTWLVILNACESSSGKILDGEGILNMVRIFSLSEIPIVVASLWRNDDRKTAEVLNYFYEFIFAGNSVVEALTLAKRKSINKFKKNDEPPLPYFWAALEVYQNCWISKNPLLVENKF